MSQSRAEAAHPLNLVPFPRRMRLTGRSLIISSAPRIEVTSNTDDKEMLAAEQVRAVFAEFEQKPKGVTIHIGSLTNISESSTWLNARELSTIGNIRSEQGYILRIDGKGIRIIGKSSMGALYATQTLLQLIRKEHGKCVIPCLEISDFPAVEQRFLAPAMSWYAGYGRIGFASQLWGWEQWRWFLDWCLSHKINGISLCIYGYYPFRLEEYPESVFGDIEMKTWLNEASEEVTIRYTHPNVQREFLPQMIKYANERGIQIYCYFGLNTFNGGYALAHPESRYYSEHPEKFRQFKYNLCPSREDVRRYLEASVRKLLRLGFNGIVLEESEGSGFCECDRCRAAYYDESMDSRKALHRADYELFNRLYRIIKDENPKAVVGVRMWRMGSEMGVDYLGENKDKIPSDTLIFWSNGIDYEWFRGWVRVFGPERIMGQDAELLGFSALYAGLIYMMPHQYSNYTRYVDRQFKPSYPQTLYNDIRQYKQAAKHGCRGVTGYAFNWNGWEVAPLSLAQYGWNPNKFSPDYFVKHGYEHLFGPEAGRLAYKALLSLPIVLETRVCEGANEVPRDDPVSGGLAGLTSLQVPTRFGEGRGELKALQKDLKMARRALELAQGAQRVKLEPQYGRSLRYLENAARRTICICRAGIEYRKALKLEKKSNPPRDKIVSHLKKSLDSMEEDYLLVKESAFDLTEEFFERITRAIETIRSRLERWKGTRILNKR